MKGRSKLANFRRNNADGVDREPTKCNSYPEDLNRIHPKLFKCPDGHMSEVRTYRGLVVCQRRGCNKQARATG